LCGAFAMHFEPVAIPRCAAEQYPRIILGVNDLTLFERTLPWDHAAGVLCLTEAGGVATRFDGSPYRVDDLRSGLIAASTPALWDEACGYLGTV
jgi:fructose-1,6-bisphosphatase/inositol monophosphatase family enzyme